MARILGLLHHAIRIGKSPEALDKARHFYEQLLGLTPSPSRPYVPGIPGMWYDTGAGQLHLMGTDDGEPRVIFPDGRMNDPTVPHVALMVDDLEGIRAKLISEGIGYWQTVDLVGVEQLFFCDPFGNQIEVQQPGKRADRPA